MLEGFREESSSSPRDELHKELLKLREIYHLDYSGHLDEIYKGETLYRTVEYMRKKKKRSPQ